MPQGGDKGAWGDLVDTGLGLARGSAGKRERRRETAGRIRWQFNTRAGPMFTFNLLEVGNCKSHGSWVSGLCILIGGAVLTCTSCFAGV